MTPLTYFQNGRHKERLTASSEVLRIPNLAQKSQRRQEFFPCCGSKSVNTADSITNPLSINPESGPICALSTAFRLCYQQSLTNFPATPPLPRLSSHVIPWSPTLSQDRRWKVKEIGRRLPSSKAQNATDFRCVNTAL